MRCKACGRVIDPNSRFCSYCDNDNYPEMNQVRIKGNRPASGGNAASPRTQYKQSTATPRPANALKPANANAQQQNGKGCVTVIIVIFFILFLLSRILTVIE